MDMASALAELGVTASTLDAEITERLERGAGGFQRRRVAVDANQPPVRRRPLEHRARVSAESQGGVAVPPGRPGGEPGQDLVQQDRDVRGAVLPRYVIAVGQPRRHVRFILDRAARVSSFVAR